jgi:hypothetical protein
MFTAFFARTCRSTRGDVLVLRLITAAISSAKVVSEFCDPVCVAT